MDDYSWSGKKGYYWIQFDDTDDGRVRAQASGPLPKPGVTESIGPVARKTADTKEEAKRLLIEELNRINA